MKQIAKEQQLRIEEINQKLAEAQSMSEEDQGNQEDDELKDQDLTEQEVYDQLFFTRFYGSLKVDAKKWFALAAIGLMVTDDNLTRRHRGFLEAIIRDDP